MVFLYPEQTNGRISLFRNAKRQIQTNVTSKCLLLLWQFWSFSIQFSPLQAFDWCGLKWSDLPGRISHIQDVLTFYECHEDAQLQLVFHFCPWATHTLTLLHFLISIHICSPLGDLPWHHGHVVSKRLRWRVILMWHMVSKKLFLNS